jgi:hypothetical protein
MGHMTGANMGWERRPVFTRVEDLLDDLSGGRVWRLETFEKHVDSLSGSPFQRVLIEGSPETLIVKDIAAELDWLMRILRDGTTGRTPRALTMWKQGILAAMPPEIDTAIVGMAYDAERGHVWQVMRDVSPTLVPPGNAMVPMEQHRRFLDHLAAMHLAFWGFVDRYGLTTPSDRYGFAHPSHAAKEAAAGHQDPIPQLFPSGWSAVRALAPEAADAALAIAADTRALAAAMAGGPQTLVHGDWKFGNLGSRPDGRTVLLDWGWPGQSGPCVDLGWYLAVNCDRLPESKEDTITVYRTALERRGVITEPWWDPQLDLALLGAFVQMGWSKAGDPDELAWWTDRVVATAQSLGTA